MARRPKTGFEESLQMNNFTWRQYYNRLMELSMVMFEWKGLPDTVDPRFLELTLFRNGSAIFFKDDVMGYLTLASANYGTFNVYNVPKERRAFWMYLIIPLISMFIQMFSYGILLIVLGSSVSAFTMFLFLLDDQSDKAVAQAIEIGEQQLRIRTLQMRPHFIHNTFK